MTFAEWIASFCYREALFDHVLVFVVFVLILFAADRPEDT